MLRVLDSVRNGTMDPSMLRYGECTRRSHSMDLSKFTDVEQIHSGNVNTLDIEAIEGRYMLSGGADGTIALYDLDNITGKPEYTSRSVHVVNRTYRHGHNYNVETVQWYPCDTGMFISSALDGFLKLWDTNTFKRVTQFYLPQRIYQHHMAPPTQAHCLVATARMSEFVTLVDIKSGSHTHNLSGHSDTPMSVRWSHRFEHVLVSGGYGNSLVMWDIRSPKSVLHRFDQHNKSNTSSNHKRMVHGGTINGLCFTSDGQHLLSYGTDNRLNLWDMYTGRKQTVNFGKIENESRKTIKIDVSRDSNPGIVYVPSKGRICAFELRSGMEVSRLIGHYNVVNCCTYHPLYEELYSGGNDKNILVWNANKEQADAYDDATRVKETTTASNRISVRSSVTADTWSDED